VLRCALQARESLAMIMMHFVVRRRHSFSRRQTALIEEENSVYTAM
jgi:hypothetical protein